MLRNTDKGIELKRMGQMIDFAKSIGLNVELRSIFGLPEETFEKAHEILEFARARGVPIQSQQVHLYFGSEYQKNPEKYGFKPLAGYLPAYLSIGDRYETRSLTSKDIRRLRNISFLANESFRRDVPKFEMVDFLLSNEEDLCAEASFYENGALLGCELEEQELLWKFLNMYVAKLNPDQSHLGDLLSKLRIFEETNRAGSATSRIILDCKVEIGGHPLPGLKTSYQDVVLGQSIFPQSCEMHLVGIREGQEKTFQFTFPRDYPVPELRDKTAKMWAKVHKVFNPIGVTSLDDLKRVKIRNHYPLLDLDRLSKGNDVLYHLTLKGIPEPDLVKLPSHFLMHVYHCAKLHRIENVKRLAELLPDSKEVLEGFADVLFSAGRYLEAAYYYGQINSNKPALLIKKARSLLSSGEAERALEMLNSTPESSSLPFQEALLECLNVVQPDSERIARLDHDLLDLKVEAALNKEIIEFQTSVQPIVHGLD